MKAFITGGAGFAGSHLVDYLLGLGQEVAVLAPRLESPHNLAHVAPRIRILEGDVRDGEGLAKILRDVRPDRIFHLAALSSPAESLRLPELAYAVNFGGSLNLLNACRNLQLDCRILLVSSPQVYGSPPADLQPIREDFPLRPMNPYAASKAAAELLAIQYFESYGAPIVRVRPFNHTGPRQSRNYVCSGLALQAAEAELGLRPPDMVARNLNSQRDFCDVRDIVRGYHLLIEGGQPGDVYHLCSGRGVAIKEVAKILASFVPLQFDIRAQESDTRFQDAPLIVGDASKARQAVGWVPEYFLEVTLRDLEKYWVEALSSGCVPAASGTPPAG